MLVGLHASRTYSFADSTISDLGNTRCRTIRGDVLCSPWHSGMNSAFAWFGCTLAIGAVLLLSRHVAGRLGAAAVVLWSISGAGSVGVALTPVNEHPGLHGLVATPIFVAQPFALLLTALALRHARPRLAAGSMAIAAASAVGTASFFALVLTDSSSAVGLTERLALWPGYVWVGVVAATLTRRPRV